MLKVAELQLLLLLLSVTVPELQALPLPELAPLLLPERLGELEALPELLAAAEGESPEWLEVAVLQGTLLMLRLLLLLGVSTPARVVLTLILMLPEEVAVPEAQPEVLPEAVGWEGEGCPVVEEEPVAQAEKEGERLGLPLLQPEAEEQPLEVLQPEREAALLTLALPVTPLRVALPVKLLEPVRQPDMVKVLLLLPVSVGAEMLPPRPWLLEPL